MLLSRSSWNLSSQSKLSYDHDNDHDDDDDYDDDDDDGDDHDDHDDDEDDLHVIEQIQLESLVPVEVEAPASHNCTRFVHMVNLEKHFVDFCFHNYF